MPISPGTRFHHYEILAPLGAGGMGEVYLAEDRTLSRKVALKLLPAEFTQDAARLGRFAQEARAASALNHPNLITIHEIGQQDGTHYLVTEFIEGATLRQRLKRERLSLPTTLDIAAQIASALTAAHTAGIIHRDIKPENVMIRPDGLVKVLDFGLAKLTEMRNADFGLRNAEADTLIQTPQDNPHSAFPNPQLTDPGTVMGTASYMSPEQARGSEQDARTDIFSLGIVLYEMIAGCAPFSGATVSDVISEILKTEPRALTNVAPDTPAELQRIISKALQKDRERRYQTSKDLLLDLQTLKQELELEVRLKGREASHEGAQPLPPITTDEGQKNRTTSSASIIFSELKLHKRGVALALAALFVIVGGAGFWLYKFINQKAPASGQALKITRLTSTGKATRAAISPDGKYVVYAQDEGGQQSLWVTQVAASSKVQIVPPAEANYVGITFARDGNFIYYVRTDKENPNGALWHSPVLGGNARKLLVNVGSPITLSPDGKQLAFVRIGEGESALIVTNADGSEEKKLAMRKSPDQFSPSGPAWSPDGKIIACGNWKRAGSVYRNVVGVRVADGAEQPITSHRWEGGLSATRIAWLADNNGVFATGIEQSGSLHQIWYLSFPGDDVRRVTNDLNGYSDISLTADSGTLAAVEAKRVVNLWVAPNGEASRARQITSGADREDGVRGLAWTPDSRVVYRSIVGGYANIWIIEADGAGNKQLTTNARQNQHGTVSPDGRYIVWSYSPTRSLDIWRMDVDGSNPKQLTSSGGAMTPQVSPDGKWVVYTKIGGVTTLWKIPIDGGEPVQLTDKTSMYQVISPDGKLIACYYFDEVSGSFKIAVIPFDGGAPLNLFDLNQQTVQWTPDGRAIAFIRTTNGVSNLWAQPLAGGEPKQLTEFKDQRIFNFAWSRDGKQLALSRGVVNSDVVLLSGFR